jgi:hypothetical protein
VIRVVSYEQLALEVEKLYSKQFNDHQVKEINEHCEYIADYIIACGWSVEEYLDRWLQTPMEN